MENASKALIIAGAILISILLISVGILVMNSISEPVEQAGSSAQSHAIQSFNADFSGYIGINMDYNTAKSVIGVVKAANGTTDVRADFNNREVELVGITSISQLSKTSKYTIEADDLKGNDGYYDTITITEE